MDVLEEWIVTNGKPKKVMLDNGKQFTSKIRTASESRTGKTEQLAALSY
ncbi:MAG: hypothetical protein WCC17_25755 [Candidatus Nitrosopolaris sp.]